eukprot:14830755-Alexandrium_andersonii.AAC.1
MCMITTSIIIADCSIVVFCFSAQLLHAPSSPCSAPAPSARWRRCRLRPSFRRAVRSRGLQRTRCFPRRAELH